MYTEIKNNTRNLFRKYNSRKMLFWKSIFKRYKHVRRRNWGTSINLVFQIYFEDVTNGANSNNNNDGIMNGDIIIMTRDKSNRKINEKFFI